MYSSIQIATATLFLLTFLFVVVAEFAPHLPSRRAAALASIAAVVAAIGLLAADPPKARDWPLMSWSESGKAKRRGPVRAHAADGDDSGGEPARHGTADTGPPSFAEGNSASEQLERAVVMAFRAPAKRRHSAGDTLRDCERCPELLVVPPGNGWIGADDRDGAATAAEQPRSIVRIWPGFLMSKDEISANEYCAFAVATGRNPVACVAGEPAHQRPAATCVSFEDASAYARWLTRITGRVYRLPSQAEWEYVARATGAVTSAARAGAPLLRASSEYRGGDHQWGFWSFGGGVAEIAADCWRSTLDGLAANGSAHEPDVRGGTRVLKDGGPAKLNYGVAPRRAARFRATSRRHGSDSGSSVRFTEVVLLRRRPLSD